MSGGGWIRTIGLQRMRLTSYQTALLRIDIRIIHCLSTTVYARAALRLVQISSSGIKARRMNGQAIAAMLIRTPTES